MNFENGFEFRGTNPVKVTKTQKFDFIIEFYKFDYKIEFKYWIDFFEYRLRQDYLVPKLLGIPRLS